MYHKTQDFQDFPNQMYAKLSDNHSKFHCLNRLNHVPGLLTRWKFPFFGYTWEPTKGPHSFNFLVGWRLKGGDNLPHVVIIVLVVTHPMSCSLTWVGQQSTIVIVPECTSIHMAWSCCPCIYRWQNIVGGAARGLEVRRHVSGGVNCQARLIVLMERWRINQNIEWIPQIKLKLLFWYEDFRKSSSVYELAGIDEITLVAAICYLSFLVDSLGFSKILLEARLVQTGRFHTINNSAPTPLLNLSFFKTNSKSHSHPRIFVHEVE
jgi:hypothetical protein